MATVETTLRSAHFPPAASQPLRQQVAWTVAGYLVYGVCQWGIVVGLARLGSPQMVGEWAFALAVITPLLMFANLQLRTLLATDQSCQFSFHDYLTLRLISGGAVLALVGVFGCLSWQQDHHTMVLLLVATLKVVESISDICYGMFQRYDRADWMADSLAMRAALSLAALLAVVTVMGSLAWALAVTLLVSCLAAMGLDLPRAQQLASRERVRRDSLAVLPTYRHAKAWTGSVSQVGSLAWRSVPLGMVALLLAMHGNLPRYWIHHHWGTTHLGVFAVITHCVVPGQIVMTAVGQAAGPRLASLHAQQHRGAFRRFVARLLGFAFLLALAGVVASLVVPTAWLSWCFGAEYPRSASLLPAVMVAGGLGYVASVFGVVATATRRIWAQPLAVVAVLAVAAGTSWVWIEPMGLSGAVYSVVATSASAAISYGMLLFCKASEG